jgi:phenylacetate-CoA ligase
MINWRRPILHLYDTYVRRNPVPVYASWLNDFYSWPAEYRREVQSRRLKDLLLHAARNVPYYRKSLIQRGIVRNGVVDLDRFRDVPELTRDILQTEFGGLQSDDLSSRDWYENKSGGSSGEPVRIIQERHYEQLGLATIAMHYGWAGRSPGEPLVKLWGSDRDVLHGTLGWRNELSNFIRNQIFLNSFKMSRVNLERYSKSVWKTRPVVIEAYAESIYELALFMNGSDFKDIGISSVITSAGTLFPFIRDEIERAFGCPTLNRYGSREVGTIAAERTAGAGLEVFSYTHLVEVVDDDGQPCGPGEEGHLLVTCLTNFAMPIIRYRIGDRALVGDVAPTSIQSVERLLTVTGRSSDAFVREDGSTVPGIFFVHFLGVVHQAEWLKKVQIIQQDYNKILIRIVSAAPPPLPSLGEMRASLQQIMGRNCRIDFEMVEDIPPLPSGKYQYTRSLVPRSAPAD